MADVKINMMLNDSGNTIQKRTTETKALNSELTKTQKLAQGVSMPGGGGGGRPPMTSGEVVEYGRSRAVGAGTGASARDFANQAQGLGGLVRIYATVAANIFAVTAAAGVLSDAMDTTNMVRGLDQLGAASGQNLGTLSKRLADATDGAVSLRQAMEATAKASSAGLSSTQILQMGDAAKKASLALGVDMGDALSRLSRGISKLEPELLDELGIYVKIDDAVQNYARSVGKTATQLTDFERRQAFAVAALDQANKKFGDVKLDANPYTQLLATFRDVMQQILSITNTVLGPVVKIFADNSALIVGALGLIAAKILKGVLPVFGEWRAGLRKAADDAKTAAGNIAEKLGADWVESWETKLKLPELQKSVQEAKKQLTSITTATNAGRLGVVKRVLSPDYKPEQRDIDELTKKYKDKQATIELLSQKTDQAALKRVQQLQREQAEIFAVRAAVQQYITTVDSLGAAQKRVDDQAEKRPGLFSLEAAKIREATRLGAAVKRTDAILEASNVGGQYGFRAGFDTLKKQIDEKGIKGFEKLRTTVVGTFSVGLSAIGTWISRFGMIGQVVGLAVAGFQLLDSWLSKNNKQLADATKALDYLGESGENLSRTLDAINRKDPLEKLSAQSIQARSTAINDLVSNIQASFDKIRLATESANWWDNMIQGIKGIFGQDLISVGARNLTAQVGAVLAGALEGPEKDKFKSDLTELFGTDDIKEWAKELGKSPEIFLEKMPQVLKLQNDFNTATQNNASRLTQLNNTISEINKNYDNFLISSIPKDALATIGNQLLTFGDQLNQAFTDVNNQIATLIDLSKDPKILRVFGPETQSYFIKESSNIKTYIKDLEYLKSSAAAAQAEVDRISQASSKTGRGGSGVTQKDIEKLPDLNEQLKTYNDLIPKIQNKLDASSEKLRNLAVQAFEKGANLISNAIDREFQKADLTLRNAFNITAQGTVAGTVESYDIQRRSLDLEIAALDAQLELIRANQRSTNFLEEIALNTKIMANPEIKTQELETASRTLSRRQEVESTKRYQGEKALENLKEDLLKGGVIAQVARTFQSTVFSSRAVEAQIAGKKAEGTVLETKQRVDVSKIELENTNRIRDLELKRLSTAKELLSLSSNVLQYKSKELLNSEALLDRETLQVTQAKEISSINNDIANQKQTIARIGDREGSASANQALKELEKKKRLIEQNQELDRQVQEKRRLEAFLNNELKLLQQRNQLLDQAYALEQNAAKVRSARLDVLKTTGGISQEGAARLDLSNKLQDIESKRTLELQKQDDAYETGMRNAKSVLQFQLAGNITEEQRAIARKQYAETATQLYQTLYNSSVLTEDNARTEGEVARLAGIVAVEKGKQADIQEKLNNQEQIRSALNANFTSGLEIQKQDLQLMLDKGQISLDNYNEQVYAVDQIARNNEYNNKVLASAVKLQTTLLAIETDRRIQSQAGPVNEAALQQRAQTALAIYQAETTGYRNLLDSQNRYAEGTKKLGERMEGYLSAVEKAFAGVGDAIVQWAETGEWSWKKMVNSMIADMIRFEMQMQMSTLYKGLRGGVMNLLGMSAAGVPLDRSWGNFDYSGFSFARGGAFNGSMEYFAKGGTFTNSIVDNPTIFKFAKGVGMMGEAGPEAIMPLKRDSSGNLGVRSDGGGKTEVVVNNYGTEKATAQESVDSRGNRRIEVTIGEMTAGEMTRSGSGTQNALRSTFGLRPQLIRR